MESQEDTSRTSLMFAAQNGHLEACNYLIQNHGANVNAEDQFKYTPLSLAAQGGHSAVVKLLIESKADPVTQTVYGETPLMIAARNGHAEVVDTLLPLYGPKELRMEDEEGKTAALEAAR